MSDILRSSKELSRRMDEVTKNIDKLVRQVASTSEVSSIFWSNLNVELRKQYSDAKKIFQEWSEEEIVKFYNKSISENLNKINKSKFYDGKYINITKFKNKDSNKQTTNALIEEANGSYIVGLDSGQKELLRLFSMSQQINVAMKEGRKVLDPYKAIRDEILNKALDQKYITIIDKNGNKRSYNIKKYSEMVARTKLRESSTLGVVNSASEGKEDLIQVSSHNTTTPFDSQFEGKIYSLSGRDPDFPQATFLPPFHPNCLHSITIVIRRALENRGIQKYIDFSTGKTEKHPTRTKHIPISERKLA